MQTLRDVLAAGPLSADDALVVAAQLAAALRERHAAGTPHRGVGPGLVLVQRRDGHPVATLLDPDGSADAPYLAPEQWRGGDVGPAADVYAVGGLLVAMVRGAAPAEAKPHAPAPPAGLPRALAPVIAAATADDPAQRPTAPALLDALAAARTALGAAGGTSAPRRVALVGVVLGGLGLVLLLGVGVPVALRRTGLVSGAFGPDGEEPPKPVARRPGDPEPEAPETRPAPVSPETGRTTTAVPPDTGRTGAEPAVAANPAGWTDPGRTPAPTPAETGRTPDGAPLPTGRTDPSATPAPADPGRTGGAEVADTGRTTGAQPADTGRTGASSPADTGRTGASSPADTGRTGASSPADTGRAGASSPADTGRTGANDPDPTGRTGANAPDPTGREGANAPEPTGRTGANAPDPTGRSGANAPDSTGRSGANDPDPTGRTGANAPDPTGRSGANAPDSTGRSGANAPDPTGRSGANAPDSTGRSATASHAPTGRTAVPPGYALHVRPDGSETLLVRIPGGPVVEGRSRIHVEPFWIEIVPVGIEVYARFLAAAQARGLPARAWLPAAGPSRSALEAHLDRGGALPREALGDVAIEGVDAYAGWAGLEPLDPRQRRRAREVLTLDEWDVRAGRQR